MKKLLLPMFCLCGLAAGAQGTFFLQPFAGGGITNIAYKEGKSKTNNLENAATYDGGVLAGYREGNWVFTAGLQYLRTGWKVTITYTDQLGNPIGTKGFYTYFNQPTLPLGVGHTFRSDRSVSLTPVAGAAISYNVSGVRSDYNGGGLKPIPKDQFNSLYATLNGYVYVKLDIDFWLSDKLSLTAGPSLYYMATNLKRPFNPIGSFGYVDKVHTYALLLNVGLKWQPGKQDQGPDDETEPE